MNIYQLTGEIYLPDHKITVTNPKFYWETVEPNQVMGMATVVVMFIVVINGVETHLSQTFPGRPITAEALANTAGAALETAMLNIPEITGRYTLIEP